MIILTIVVIIRRQKHKHAVAAIVAARRSELADASHRSTSWKQNIQADRVSHTFCWLTGEQTHSGLFVRHSIVLTVRSSAVKFRAGHAVWGSSRGWCLTRTTRDVPHPGRFASVVVSLAFTCKHAFAWADFPSHLVCAYEEMRAQKLNKCVLSALLFVPICGIIVWYFVLFP